MKSERITVTSQGAGISTALDMTEKTGIDTGLGKKEVLHLRLLSEELFGMLRSITGNISADYWIERIDRSFELHLLSYVDMNQVLRRALLAVATTGIKTAARGFMG